jgi:hypothetical protein
MAQTALMEPLCGVEESEDLMSIIDNEEISFQEGMEIVPVSILLSSAGDLGVGLRYAVAQEDKKPGFVCQSTDTAALPLTDGSGEGCSWSS